MSEAEPRGLLQPWLPSCHLLAVVCPCKDTGGWWWHCCLSVSSCRQKVPPPNVTRLLHHLHRWREFGRLALGQTPSLFSTCTGQAACWGSLKRVPQGLHNSCGSLSSPLLTSPPLELQIPWNRSVLLQWFGGEMEDDVVPLVPHSAEGKDQLKECSARG